MDLYNYSVLCKQVYIILECFNVHVIAQENFCGCLMPCRQALRETYIQQKFVGKIHN